jgi:hypothetical protein
LGGVVAIEAAARSAAVELLSTIYTTLGEKFATLDDGAVAAQELAAVNGGEAP